MFVATMLDCFPDRAMEMDDLMVKAGFKGLVTLEKEAASDGVLTGTRFKVHAAGDASSHDHRHYSDIRSIIESSALDPETMRHALGIFRELAQAEAKVHGTDIEKVTFHEVGAWDSIADIVCAAWVIRTTGATSWSVSKLPLGSGRVKTAHGSLPVPAPATSLLLEDFEFFDDGIDGERITPTGAAILKYLAPAQGLPALPLRLDRSGYGMGTKRFEGISNVLRALVFHHVDSPVWRSDQVLQVEFEVDDQSLEDLALGLERIREVEGVLDVLQTAGFGKKSRQVVCVRVLARPDVEAELLRRCFDETTTLGVRRQLVNRAVLSREDALVESEQGRHRVKVASRPGGRSAKSEMDDVIHLNVDHAGRKRIREEAEKAALKGKDGSEHD